MSELLALSAEAIDSGLARGPVNRVTNELSEVADGIAVVESFSHLVALQTDDGLVCVDASGAHTGRAVTGALRTWSTDPVRALVYTHGHVDHVGGSGALLADGADRGHSPPEVVGHEALPGRFERYRVTDRWNTTINARQFGGVSPRAGLGLGGSGNDDDGRSRPFLPADVAEPSTVVGDRHDLDVGGLRVELHHALGETDDHLWAWIPERRAICAGDFVIWMFPNAGNPQKVQRYPSEWAAALREMASLDAELLLPAHGLPVGGAERVRTVLTTTAEALEALVHDVLERMNAGWPLDDIVHDVRVPDEALALPWLQPLYDEPEFVVRNVWRRYGGWWDGDPSRLKPAPAASLAGELAALAGGPARLAERGLELAGSGEPGDLRLACHLVELAVQAAPADTAVHQVRAEVYQRRRDGERSLMSKGIFAAAANESRALTERA
jgi:alkyl sulfatase BDS1-like metallo-beta-lactamase superfamily hydrolase